MFDSKWSTPYNLITYRAPEGYSFEGRLVPSMFLGCNYLLGSCAFCRKVCQYSLDDLFKRVGRSHFCRRRHTRAGKLSNHSSTWQFARWLQESNTGYKVQITCRWWQRKFEGMFAVAFCETCQELWRQLLDVRFSSSSCWIWNMLCHGTCLHMQKGLSLVCFSSAGGRYTRIHCQRVLCNVIQDLKAVWPARINTNLCTTYILPCIYTVGGLLILKIVIQNSLCWRIVILCLIPTSAYWRVEKRPLPSVNESGVECLGEI